MHFFSYVKENCVGPVKILQDQQILGVTGPSVPVTFWVSVKAWKALGSKISINSW